MKPLPDWCAWGGLHRRNGPKLWIISVVGSQAERLDVIRDLAELYDAACFHRNWRKLEIEVLFEDRAKAGAFQRDVIDDWKRNVGTV